MADHYVAINRGKDGFRVDDFTFGAASSAASDIELRIADLDSGGVLMTKKDIVVALKAFERALLSGAAFSTFPPL